MTMSPDIAILIMSALISLSAGILIHSTVARYKQRKLNREFAAFHMKNLRKGKYDDEIISHALAEEIADIMERQNSGEGNAESLGIEKDQILNELHDHIIHCWREREKKKRERVRVRSDVLDAKA